MPGSSLGHRHSWRAALPVALALLLILGERALEYRRVGAAERLRLVAEAQRLDGQIGQQLRTVDMALRGLRDDFQDPGARSTRQGYRIRALLNVMPGVSGIFVLDAQGRITASGGDHALGSPGPAPALFEQARGTDDPVRLYLGTPQRSAWGAVSLFAARELRREDGSFNGLVMAALDVGTLSGTLAGARYAPDVRVVLRRAGGAELVRVASDDASERLDAPPAGRADPMGVARPVRPDGVPLDPPLELSVAREPDAVYAPWRRTAGAALGFWALASAAWWGLRRQARQRREALDAQALKHLQELQANEESLSITLASIGDAVVATDARGLVVRMNPAAERLIGLPLASAQGRPLAEVFRIVHAGTREPARDPVEQVLGSGKVVGLANDTLLLAHDGSEYQIADSAAPIRNALGEVVGVVLVFSDVTERYHTAQALREREHQLTLLLDALPGPVSRADEQGRVVFANRAYGLWFGVDPLAIVGKTHAEFLPDEVLARALPRLERARGGEVVSYESELTSPRLGRVHALVRLMPYRNEAGELRGTLSIMVDISDRKRAEAALQASEQRWRAVLDNMAEGVVIADAEGGPAYWNAAARRLYDLDALPNRPGSMQDMYRQWQLLDADGQPLPLERWPMARLMRGEKLRELTLSLRHRGEDRERVFRYNGASVLDEAGRRLAYLSMTDITEATRAERALARTLAQMARTGALARVGGWEMDMDTGMLELSAEIRALMEIDAQVEMSCHEAHVMFYPPEMGEVLETARQQALATGTGWDLHSSFTTATGRQLWVRSRGQAVMRDGRVVGLSGAVQDVTDLHQSQQKLEQQAAMLKVASRAAQFGAWLVDATSREVKLSDELCGILEFPPGHALTLEQGVAMYPPGYRETLNAVLQACLEHGTPFDVELEVITATGRRLNVRSAGMAVKDAQGRIVSVQGAYQDITERKRAEAQRRDLEAQLRESQKMESVGTLAGGIAHDFNNILGAILGNVALARDDLGPGHPALESLEQIQTAGLRARAMVQQILAFSRRQPHELLSQPLRPVLEESLSLLRATLPARVRLATRFSAAPIRVRADATQIQQVMLNLCTNAWHAMHGSSGLIEVGLEPATLDQQAARRLSALAAGDYAHVWVRDNGNGIEPATLARIFEPFFTTKPVGQGTGLGLAVVHGIVLSHHGAISVDSAPGKGSTFHLYFPVVAGELAEDGSPRPHTEPLRGSGQHVLYTDDDEVMLLLVERLLLRLNYRVSCYSDPRQAVREVQARPRAFDLVITDFNMPEMSGLEVAEAVRNARPDLPVILSSGYLSEDLRTQAQRLGVVSLLQKQNTHDDLAEVVHRVFTRPT